MLPLDAIDLDALVMALENHYMDDDTFFWLDPATGKIVLWGEEAADEADAEGWDVDDRGGIRIDPVESLAVQRDMEDFIGGVKEEKCRERLQRAVDHSSPLRHFKDALYEFPEQQTEWYEFHGATMKRRAIEWLAEWDVVDRASAGEAIAKLGDSATA